MNLHRLLRYLLLVPALPLLLTASPVSAWEYVLDSPGWNDLPPAYDRSHFDNVAVDGQGNVIACGILLPEKDPPGHIVVVKLSGEDGSLLWQKAIVGSLNWRSTNYCRTLRIDTQGDVFVGGQVAVNSYDTSQFALVKLAGDSGREIWSRWLGDLAPYTFSMLAAASLDSGGDVFALGHILADGYGDVVLKFSGATGNEFWRAPARPVDLYRSTLALAVDALGDPVIARPRLSPSGSLETAIAKLSGMDGHPVWDSLPERPLGSAVALSIDARGDVLAASTGGIMKLDGLTGAIAWTAPVPAARIFPDTRNDVLAAFIDGIAKLDDATGGELWRWNAAPGSYVLDARPDAGGNVAVIGGILGEPGRMTVLDLSGSDGRLRWSRMFADRLGGHGLAVAVDSAGDVVAAGILDSIATDPWGGEHPYGKAVVVKLWGPTGVDFPPTPQQILAALSEAVATARLHDPIGSSLARNVAAAAALLQDEDPANDHRAVDFLEVLIRKASALRGKKIAAGDADAILSFARQAIAALSRS